jgi:hypothetical protein
VLGASFTCWRVRLTATSRFSQSTERMERGEIRTVSGISQPPVLATM